MSIDWKSYLEVHYPNIARIYMDTPSTMKKVDRKLQERNDDLLRETRSHETTFYDLFIRIIEPKIGSARERESFSNLLKFIDGQVGEFVGMVNDDSNLVSQLKKQLEKLFLFNGNKYLDQIGELASTAFLVKVLKNYRLRELEYVHDKAKVKGEKGKDVDLLFVEKATGSLMLVDIINLHLEHERIENEAGLRTLILHRLSEKRAAKETSSYLSDENSGRIYLQPFIWLFDIGKIRQYKQFFKDLQIDFTLPVLCLRQRSDNEGKLQYDCVEIAEIDA